MSNDDEEEGLTEDDPAKWGVAVDWRAINRDEHREREEK